VAPLGPVSPLSNCLPPFWARDGHTQTIISHLLPSPPLPADRERVEIALADGDRLVGYLFKGTKPIVVAGFHGLSGCSDSRYMRRTAAVCRRLGFWCLLVNHRGCGPGKGLAKGPYHSGRGEDVSEAFTFLKARLPGYRRIGVGFSLGGNALLLLLSGGRGTEVPEAALAVNAPIRLERAAEQLRAGWNRIYDTHFVKLCRRSIEERRAAGLIGDEYRLPRKLSLMEFDDYYTAPAGGFADRHDYYATCSTVGRLDRIQVPTVLLTAQDDPFVDYRDYAAAKLSAQVKLHLEKHGGHIGYLSRGPNLHWIEQALEHYLTELSGL
jgi:uncharacterized protein